jgi:hypothetical protein
MCIRYDQPDGVRCRGTDIETGSPRLAAARGKVLDRLRKADFAALPADVRKNIARSTTKGDRPMRKSALAVTFIALTTVLMTLATPGVSRQAEWCSKIEGARHCGYYTEAQCRASVSGRMGHCVRSRHSKTAR